MTLKARRAKPSKYMLQVSLSAAQKRTLSAWARARRCTMSDIVRAVIDQRAALDSRQPEELAKLEKRATEALASWKEHMAT